MYATSYAPHISGNITETISLKIWHPLSSTVIVIPATKIMLEKGLQNAIYNPASAGRP